MISIWECLQDQDPSLLKLQQISKKPPTAMKSTEMSFISVLAFDLILQMKKKWKNAKTPGLP